MKSFISLSLPFPSKVFHVCNFKNLENRLNKKGWLSKPSLLPYQWIFKNWIILYCDLISASGVPMFPSFIAALFSASCSGLTVSLF